MAVGRCTRLQGSVAYRYAARDEVLCCPDASELSSYTGRYRDPWFGDVIIGRENGQLVFTADKSSKFHGGMRQHDGNRFIVRWTDRTLEADAYVLFETDKNDQVTAISMTKLQDGDYDFEDLKLKKVE